MIRNPLFVFISLSLTALHFQHKNLTSNKVHRHEFVRKGDQANDMKMGDYVVVAKTVSEADAKKFVKEMKKLNLPVPSYGYQSNKQFWFVYFEASDGIESARLKRNELRKNDLYKSAWLLTIHQ